MSTYGEQGIEHLVTSSAMYERFLAQADRYAVNVDFYERLEREGSLIYQVPPVRGRPMGPTVTVYRMARDEPISWCLSLPFGG